MEQLHENQLHNVACDEPVGSEECAALDTIEAVRTCAEEQIRREDETRREDPQAYRLSALPEGMLNGHYRRGKRSMSGDDVLRYFNENRRVHLQSADLEKNTGIDECSVDPETGKSLILSDGSAERALTPIGQAKSLAVRGIDGLKRMIPTWIDLSRADDSRESRRFPLSAFAAVLTVALSLMLIVASSVLLTRAENDVSRLRTEISDTSGEVAKLKSDFEVRHDLLEIRRIAMEEYGMVDESYVKMDYIALRSEETVENFEEEREEQVGLSALLSAIGLK